MMLEVRNPATLEPAGDVRVPGHRDMDAGIEAAADAVRQWRQTPWEKRQAALLAIADAVETESGRLAALLTTEQGKPLGEARREISAFCGIMRLYAGMDMPGQVIRDGDDALVLVEYEPYGVSALILPWNYPVGLLAWKLAPCVLAGNTALVKPSALAPLTVSEIVDIAARHLPPHVVQVFPGDDDTGRYLVAHPGISRVAFTGSREAGRDIMRSASAHLPHVTLELGGNDPAIVLDDCDLDAVFEDMFRACFFNAGQICIAIKRIYAHESIAPALVERLVERASSLKLGSGLEPGVDMGPLVSAQQLARVEALVDDARQRGARILCGGRRVSPGGLPGYFYAPTIVTDIDDDASLVREEQFGPVVPVLLFRETEDALARANSTGYGLGGSVWTSDTAKGMELARRLESGTVWVNAHMLVEPKAPFGGWKQSGTGRELGSAGLMEFLRSRTLYLKR